MTQQELDLPLWAQVVIIAVLIILLIKMAMKDMTEIVELPEIQEQEEQEKHDDNAVKERYGAYIQSQGKYYN